jgi:xanthine dehydrogenase molybdopterin-binding subunit B
MYEEFLTNSDGLAVTNSTWNYKIPTVDTIPKKFNVQLINNPHNKNRVLSSKGASLLPSCNTIGFQVHFFSFQNISVRHSTHVSTLKWIIVK